MGKFIDLTGQKYGRLLVEERGPDIVFPSGKKTQWWCRCDCGNRVLANTNELRSGNTKSCGCLAHDILIERNKNMTTHGDSIKTAKYYRLFMVWMGIKYRCENDNSRQYDHYGGRGIKLCDEWHEYATFKEWALQTGYDVTAPKGECTLDRIDVNGDYCPDNCRWADIKTQANNRTNTVYVEDNGEMIPLEFFAEKYGILSATVKKRIDLGMDPMGSDSNHWRYITFNGETHCIKEWAEIVGLRRHTLEERLRRGWTIERALTTPTIDTGRWPVNA